MQVCSLEYIMDQVDQEQPDNAVCKQYSCVNECRVYLQHRPWLGVEPLDRYSLSNCRDENHCMSNTKHNTRLHVADYILLALYSALAVDSKTWQNY